MAPAAGYSLRHAAEDKPRTARHLPEEEAIIRYLSAEKMADICNKTAVVESYLRDQNGRGRI